MATFKTINFKKGTVKFEELPDYMAHAKLAKLRRVRRKGSDVVHGIERRSEANFKARAAAQEEAA